MKKPIEPKQLIKYISKAELRDLFIKLVPNKEKHIKGRENITSTSGVNNLG